MFKASLSWAVLMSQSGHTEEQTHANWAMLSGSDAVPDPRLVGVQDLWAFMLGQLVGMKPVSRRLMWA